MEPYKTAYDLFEAWVKCLDKDGSIIFQGRNLWTEKNLEIVLSGLLRDEGDPRDSFSNKLKYQFNEYAPEDDLWLLLCELMALHYCPNNVDNLLCLRVLESRSDYEELKDEANVVKDTKAFANLGPAHGFYVWVSVRYFASFAKRYKQDEKLRSLVQDLMGGNPQWDDAGKAFSPRELIDAKYYPKSISSEFAPFGRILLHLLCRNHHSYITSDRDVRRLLKHYSSKLEENEKGKSEGERIYLIMNQLGPSLKRREHSELPDVYAPEIEKQWRIKKVKEPPAVYTKGTSSTEAGTETNLRVREVSKKLIKEDVIAATKELDLDNLSPHRKSNVYDLVINEQHFPPKETVRYACIIALKRLNELPVTYETIPEYLYNEDGSVLDETGFNALYAKSTLEKLEFSVLRKPTLIKPPETAESAPLTKEVCRLLEHIGQIILQGPPGTGKTYVAKEVAREITGEERAGGKWKIIQFHPSYNYEDFVRGIQIKTEDGKTTYETVNRVLAQMAHDARDDEDNDYVLIIDEINRANVSAVLGELIYALEYRDEPVSTTYPINGKTEIVLPSNLYIIGTMNTADRTIGQIDYAVRRRFAFRTLPPDRTVVEEASSASGASKMFDIVNEIFDRNSNYLSSGYNTDDVAIGHSYFIAKDNEELKNKIEYQVIPILEEYIKDGVLQDTQEKMKGIKDAFTKLGTKEFESIPKEDSKPKRFNWKHEEHETSGEDLGVGRIVWSIVKDYVESKKIETIDQLKEEKVFPDNIHPAYGVVQNVDAPPKPGQIENERFFPEQIKLEDGTNIVVTREWASNPGPNRKPYAGYTAHEEFLKRAKELGYTIEVI